MYNSNWNRQGFKHTEISDTGRFNGIRVHIIDNQNGKYGFVEVGRNYELRKLIDDVIKLETLEYLFYLSVEQFINKKVSIENETYKYSTDFVEGYEAALRMV